MSYVTASCVTGMLNVQATVQRQQPRSGTTARAPLSYQ